MHSFNGMSLIINKGPYIIVRTEACDEGAGGYCEGDYFYCNWAVNLPAWGLIVLYGELSMSAVGHDLSLIPNSMIDEHGNMRYAKAKVKAVLI